MHVIGCIQPRHNLVQERLDVLGLTRGLELGDPDRASLCNLPRCVDMLLEVCDIRGRVIPVLVSVLYPNSLW